MEMWDPSASIFPLCYSLNEAFSPMVLGEAPAHSNQQEVRRRQENHVLLLKDATQKPLTFHWPELSHVATTSCKGIWKVQAYIFPGKC